MDIITLYEDLRKYTANAKQYDELFYNTPEGEVQVDIVKEILQNLLETI